ncbi:helix-turn-helix domain-containing protein [Epibacterium ulvae]|uniref:IclR family transcriptional regulator n=1 Tax=Epibacterium ulvae TaxID=1156985 RepID=UPI001BFC250F|nr:helix-turn-helix domain-containing protein [Epibacterium ulvae]MBT8154085.1 helix-turn-helix domain-containing protein [Epibacterium ulvae]
MEGRGIQSIEVGGRLLDCLVRSGVPMSLRALAAEADLTPAQTHAYLTSFKRTGMIEQKVESGPYSIGPLALNLGLARLQSVPLYRDASQLILRLSETYGFMSALVVWGPFGPTTVSVAQPSHRQYNLNIRMGTLFSVTGTASGKLFAAFGENAAVHARIKEELAGSPELPGISNETDRRGFEASVAKARKDGYATIENSIVPDVFTLALPMFESDKTLAGVITCIGSEGALKEDAFLQTLDAVRTEIMHLTKAGGTS